MKKSSLITIVLVLVFSVGGFFYISQYFQELEAKHLSENQPTATDMKNICELAVIKCYYNNVIRYYEEDATGALWWKKDMNFWVEYDCYVEVGMDTNGVNVSVEGTNVKITLPQAKILSTSLESGAVTTDSFIVADKSADPTSEVVDIAYQKAQEDMLQSAQKDSALLSMAEERVKLLLSNYVNGIGDALSVTYTIEWEYLETEST